MRLALLAAIILTGLSEHCLCLEADGRSVVLELVGRDCQRLPVRSCSPAPVNCKTSGKQCSVGKCVDLAFSDVSPSTQKVDVYDVAHANASSTLAVLLIAAPAGDSGVRTVLVRPPSPHRTPQLNI